MCRNASVWTPDKEHFEKYDQPVLYPDEVTSKWKLPPWNRKTNSVSVLLCKANMLV
jgi:hypothetical protein